MHERKLQRRYFLLLGIVLFALKSPAQKETVTDPISVSPLASIPIDASAQVVSETYLGMLLCPDCSGIRAEVTLYYEGHDGRAPIAYHATETAIGVPDRAPAEYAGFFTEQTLQDPAKLTGSSEAGNLIQFRTGKPVVQSFLRVTGDNGKLLLLNAKLHVLPDDTPHSLGRVSGEQQHGLTLLTDRDDGRTVTLKGGEVFLVVLPIHTGDDYRWNSDRPAAMALLEPSDQPPPSQVAVTQPAPWPGAAPPKTLVPVERARGNAAYHAAHTATHGATYQAWQMVAPRQENMPVERILTFQLRRPQDDKSVLPSRIVTLTIQVP